MSNLIILVLLFVIVPDEIVMFWLKANCVNPKNITERMIIFLNRFILFKINIFPSTRMAFRRKYFARFLESFCSFLQDYLSAHAVSLRIFWGTVAILSYILWRLSRRRIFQY